MCADSCCLSSHHGCSYLCPSETTEERRRCPSRELRAGILYRGCECFRRNGIQDDCPRADCQQRKRDCLTLPAPKCCPSKKVMKYVRMTHGYRKFYNPESCGLPESKSYPKKVNLEHCVKANSKKRE
ncbi:hypothetical protein HA402_004326 [Bradysia odoriphaga]|nr:hypothetical protein HA402_004326 [Bradysia odoriphaga]